MPISWHSDDRDTGGADTDDGDASDATAGGSIPEFPGEERFSGHDRPRKHPKRNLNPLEREIAFGEAAAAKEVQIIMDAVRYGTFADECSVTDFLVLRNIAMMRTIFGLDPPMMTAKVGLDVPGVMRRMESPLYQKIETALRDSCAKYAKATTIDEIAKDAEGRIAKEMLHTALISPSAKDRQKAIDALADRLSPKKGRGDGDAGVARVFPSDLVEMMRVAMEVGRRAGTRSPVLTTPRAAPIETSDDARPLALEDGNTQDAEIVDDEIESDVVDASVLNVPRPAAPKS